MRCSSAVSATIALPSARDPASPMKTRAGKPVEEQERADNAGQRHCDHGDCGVGTRDRDDRDTDEHEQRATGCEPVDTVGQVHRVARCDDRDGHDDRQSPAEVRRSEPGKELVRETGDGQSDTDEHARHPLQAELLPDGESQAFDVTDVDDVVEPAGDRAREQREERDETHAVAVHRQKDHEDDEAEEGATERGRSFLGSMTCGAVRGDVLTGAGADEEPDERGIEDDSGDKGEHPDDDRLSHGAIRQSLIIISAICFQIGAASSDPKRPV